LQRAPLEAVADIQKSPSSRIRIGISSWRGTHKCEIRECTSNIPGSYWPTSAGISLDIEKLEELIAALQKSRARAVSLGLLSGRAAA